MEVCILGVLYPVVCGEFVRLMFPKGIAWAFRCKFVTSSIPEMLLIHQVWWRGCVKYRLIRG